MAKTRREKERAQNWEIATEIVQDQKEGKLIRKIKTECILKKVPEEHILPFFLPPRETYHHEVD